MNRLLKYIAIVFLVFGFVRAGYGQDFRGGISGRLVDPTERVIPAVEVIAIDQSTGIVHKTRTSSAGEYNFNDLPVGDYTISTSAAGFSPLKVTGIHVNAGAIHGLPLKLNVVGSTSTIEVDATAVTLDTETSTVAVDIPGAVLNNVPFHSGDFLDANSRLFR